MGLLLFLVSIHNQFTHFDCLCLLWFLFTRHTARLSICVSLMRFLSGCVTEQSSHPSYNDASNRGRQELASEISKKWALCTPISQSGRVHGLSLCICCLWYVSKNLLTVNFWYFSSISPLVTLSTTEFIAKRSIVQN